MSTQPSDLDDLTLLGRKGEPSKSLEAFPNRTPDRYYLVSLETKEFTCVCPATGQPDFAKIRIQYVPDEKIIEERRKIEKGKVIKQILIKNNDIEHRFCESVKVYSFEYGSPFKSV